LARKSPRPKRRHEPGDSEAGHFDGSLLVVEVG
jgi:hypothetical protein